MSPALACLLAWSGLLHGCPGGDDPAESDGSGAGASGSAAGGAGGKGGQGGNGDPDGTATLEWLHAFQKALTRIKSCNTENGFSDDAGWRIQYFPDALRPYVDCVNDASDCEDVDACEEPAMPPRGTCGVDFHGCEGDVLVDCSEGRELRVDCRVVPGGICGTVTLIDDGVDSVRMLATCTVETPACSQAMPHESRCDGTRVVVCEERVDEASVGFEYRFDCADAFGATCHQDPEQCDAPGECYTPTPRCVGSALPSREDDPDEEPIDMSGPVCGNGIVETGEQCDVRLLNLNGATCASATGNTLPAGRLGCTADCTFNTSMCTPCPHLCANDTCAPAGSRCDGTAQCSDGSDEAGCFNCGGLLGMWVAPEARCDGAADCLGGADESSCSTCKGLAHRCANGTCKLGVSLCDGITQCGDGSDEIGCVGEECKDYVDGVYAMKVALDAWWAHETAEPDLYDPGRGTIELYAHAVVSGLSDDGLGGSAIVRLCGLELPPMLVSPNCTAIQAQFPLAMWDNPMQPAFFTDASVTGLEPGELLTLAQRLLRTGISLNPGAAFPTPDDTDTFMCPEGSGLFCFPDHDGDGRPGVSVTYRHDEALVDGPYACNDTTAQFAYYGAPVDLLGAATLQAWAFAKAADLGFASEFGASSVFESDCQHGVGAASGDQLAMRVAGCTLRDDAACSAAARSLVDASATPVYHLLGLGEAPPVAWKFADAFAAKDALLDRSSSAGPRSALVRLGDAAASFGCAAVRGAAFPAL